MTRYLDVDSLIHINARLGGGVDDLAGLEAAAFRPQSGFGGVERFPTVWAKAAAYLHGIASTQYFADGNKRTAWIAANAFLTLNGRRLPQVPDIEAEVFVQAVAQQVFNTEDEPDKTITVATEWFESKWADQRVGPASDPRLEYIFLSQQFGFANDDGSTFSVAGAGLTGSTALGEAEHPMSVEVPFSVVGRYHWKPVDRLVQHTITVEVVPEPGELKVKRRKVVHAVQQAIPPSGHPQHQPSGGLLPMIFHINMEPIFRGPTRTTVTVDFDGVRAAEIPFIFRVEPESAPSDLSELLGGQ